MAISNVVIDGVPAGGEDDYVVLDVVGEPTRLPDPKDHLELGETLGLIDMERGAKVSGSRFYFLTGRGALLQLGLLQLAVRLATDNGFTPDDPAGAGAPRGDGRHRLPGGPRRRIYRVQDDDLYLVGTSEVPLAGYHSAEILDLSGGPLRYAGWSSCFRREAGSYGKDTRGIIRVHQFDKVEGFVYCKPEEAEAEHQRLLGWQRQMLELIGVPLPGDRRRRGRSRLVGRPQVRLRGVGAHPAGLPGTDLDLQLHHLPGPPARHPLPRRDRQAADRRDAQRHPGHHPLAGRDPGEPSTTGRQRAGARRSGSLRRDGGPATVIELDLEELRSWFGFGVAGNFAGHLDQAGEAVDFATVAAKEGAPKGIFPGTHRDTTASSASSRCPTTR